MNIFARTQEVCSRYLCGWAFDVSLDGYHFVPKTAAGDHVIPTQNYPKKPTDERCTVCDQYENSHRHSIGWKHRHDFSPPPAKEKQPYLSGHNMPHEAMGPTVKSAPGNHHDEIEGNPLLERRVRSDDSTFCSFKDFQQVGKNGAIRQMLGRS